MQTGVEGAKGEYDSIRTAADQDSGKTEKDHTYGPPEDVPNLGLKAFAQYDDIKSSFHYGGTDVTVLLDNVLIEVNYNGSDGPDGQEKPMDKAKSRDGALTAAQESSGAVRLPGLQELTDRRAFPSEHRKTFKQRKSGHPDRGAHSFHAFPYLHRPVQPQLQEPPPTPTHSG